MVGSDEGIKLVSTDDEVIGTILRYVDVITIVIDIGSELRSLDQSFDGSNDEELEGLFLVDSMV